MGVRLDRLRNREFVIAVLIATALATAPLLQFWVNNRGEITSSRPIVDASGLAALIAALVTTRFVLLLRRTNQVVVGCVVGANCYLFFQWQLFDSGPYWLQYTQWLLAAVGISFIVVHLGRRPGAKLFIYIFPAVLVAVPGVSLLAAPQVSHGLVVNERAMISERNTEKSGTPPNVYFLVLDGYARADQLRRVLGYDETPFIDDLKQRGFEVPTETFASYPATFLSIASILEMDHIATSSAALSNGEKPFYPKLQGDNAAVRAFHQRGYTYVHGESGTFSASDCMPQYFDVCIEARGDSRKVTISETEQAVLQLTPFTPLLDAGVLPVGDAFTDPQSVIAQLWQDRPSDPYFVFSHVIAPHPPHRRYGDCSLREQTAGKLATGWKPELRAGYVDSLDCLNRQLLIAVDAIVSDDPTAIIVITGDHGSAFETPWGSSFESWTNDQILERYATFHAVRLPDRCDNYYDTHEARNIVNSLRIVLACIDGEAPELRQPRAFFHRYGKDLIEFDDLTVFVE